VCSIDTGCASAAFEPEEQQRLRVVLVVDELVIAPYPGIGHAGDVVEWQMRAW